MKRPEGKDRKEITVDGITYTLWTEERQPECSCAVEYMDERAFFAGNGQCFYVQAVSCEDVEGEVVIPEEVEGHSVMSLAPYAFSAKRMESLILPVTLREAGRYVFYRSFRLKKLCFSDTFTDIGAGAFTGCRLEEIEIDFYQGEQSCLKFIVDEIRYALWVTLRYHRSDGRIDTAKVVFPEHYEEAVENTPARIVETHYHGAGGYYRQTFYNKELNFKEYDSLFPLALAQENEEILTDIAAYRLLFPYCLEKKAEDKYLGYLAGHMDWAGRASVKRENLDMLRFFGERRLWDKEALNRAIEIASGEKKLEALALLMEQKRNLFPGRRKTFDL